MINNQRVLAYIPARSGSKGIKDKNIMEICGKPLIAYTIEAAKRSRYIDRLIVSTDSLRYAEVAKRWGAEVPFLRPAELATDTAPEMLTTLHLMDWAEQEWLKDNQEPFDIIFRLQCTSPLRSTEDIDQAIEELIAKDADSIMGVSEAPVSPLWMNTLPVDKSMKDFIPKHIQKKNRQELPKYFQLNGTIFVARWDFIKKYQQWDGDKTYAFIIPRERAVDIDDEIDLALAKVLLEQEVYDSKLDNP